ncbi:hypothetical protein EDB84DRAFT_136010 [Lactarius hengduanensis]|nr:hypothetical protein EDB84DRAFT_136010 [Lactarius hengduanensis]
MECLAAHGCQTVSQKTCMRSNPRVISVVRRVSRTRASYPPASYPSEPPTSTIPYPMATTNGSSTWWSRSGDNALSNSTNTLQNNDRVTDRASRRATNGTGLEGGSPYSSSIWRGYGSAVELREHTAGASSAASSDQLSWVRGPHPAPSRPFAPQTTTSKSSQPAADADAEQDAPYRADSDPPHTDTSRPHDPSAPALSSSKSAGLLAPKGYHVTRGSGAIPGLMEPSRSMPSNGRPRASAAASSPASKKIPRPSKLRVTNGDASVQPSQGERENTDIPKPR